MSSFVINKPIVDYADAADEVLSTVYACLVRWRDSGRPAKLKLSIHSNEENNLASFEKVNKQDTIGCQPA